MRKTAEFVFWASLVIAMGCVTAPHETPDARPPTSLISTFDAARAQASGAAYVTCYALPDGIIGCSAVEAPPNRMPQCNATNAYPCWAVIE